jgi:hypothetical protein
MEGFQSLHTKHHVLEPMGYGLVRKVVKRNAPVHSAVEQFRIQCIASLFQSNWISMDPPRSQESPRSYIMTELIDCTLLLRSQWLLYLDMYPLLREDVTRFSVYMIEEGYFPRGVALFRCNHGTPFRILDVSQFGTVQGVTVRFPKDPWNYSLLQAELLYGALS